MSRGYARISTACLGLGLAALSLPSCGGSVTDAEAELRLWVAEAEEAAESKDRGSLMEKIAAGYADGRGNSRENLGTMFRYYMLRQHSVAILTHIEGVTLLGDSAADVVLTVGMAGSTNKAFGLNAEAYRFELELEKDDDEWLLIGAKWGEVGGELR